MAESAKAPVAMLDASAVKQVEDLEHKLGDVYVVAYEKPVEPAVLTPEQLSILRQAERQLGVCLVAYKGG